MKVNRLLLITAAAFACVVGLWPAASLAQKPVTVVTTAGNPSLCKATLFSACVGESGRYRVELKWDDFSGNKDLQAFVHATTADSVIFKWTLEGPLEVLVAINNACALGQRTWVFAAPKTTVGFRLSITDTWSGTTRVYSNESRNAPVAITDTRAFSNCLVLPPDLDGDSFSAMTDRCPELPGPDRGCPEGELVGRMEVFDHATSGSANVFDNDSGIAGEARIYRIGLSFTDLLDSCIGPPDPEFPSTSCGPDLWLPLEKATTLELSGGRVTVDPDGDIDWSLTPALFPNAVLIQYYFRDSRGEESVSAVIISID